MIHNLINYTTLSTNHLKSDKNTITMAKSSPKRLENQSNRRNIIHHQGKLNNPKKLQQKSYRKTEATKVNAIMEKLDKSDINRYQIKNNINNFATLYELDNEEGINHRTKPKTPTIVPSEEEKGIKKGGKNKGNEEYENDWEKKTMEKVYDLDSDDETNWDSRMAEHDDNRVSDNKEKTPREKTRPIKKTKENKPSYLTVNETPLKVTHTKETNK